MASLSDFIGLVFLFIILGLLIGLGLIVYSIFKAATEETHKKLSKGGISISDKGANIQTKISSEKYLDASRDVLVNALKTNIGYGKWKNGVPSHQKLPTTDAPKGYKSKDLTEDQKLTMALQEKYRQTGKEKST